MAAGALYQYVGARRARVRFTPPGRLFDVGGHRLHAECRGAGGPVVVLESGIAASSLSWSLVQPEIATFTKVCAYDRAGFAWSDAPSCPRTFATIVNELAALLDRLTPRERLVLVGHSFGSFVVAAYASRAGRRVAGLVLIDPPTEWLAPSPAQARQLWGGRKLSRIGAVLAHIGVVRACLALLTGGRPSAPRRFVKVFGPTAARTLHRLVGEVRKLPDTVHPVVQAHWSEAKCFNAMADHLLTLERDATSIAAVELPAEIPVVVISSRDQPPAVMAAQRRLSERSVRGRHVLASRSAHWVQFDEPELIVGVVRDLVELERTAGDQHTGDAHW
jgi:pimeloyl-ACP methyl ester carboxylesterase